MPITIQEAAGLYLEALTQHGKSPRTLYTYHQDLKQVMAFFGPDKPVSSITFPLVGKFLKSDILLLLPQGQPRATATVDKTIRVFRMFLIWAKSQGYLETLPLTKDIPLGRSVKQAEALSDLAKDHHHVHYQEAKLQHH